MLRRRNVSTSAADLMRGEQVNGRTHRGRALGRDGLGGDPAVRPGLRQGHVLHGDAATIGQIREIHHPNSTSGRLVDAEVLCRDDELVVACCDIE
jgi:hypothetical protein